MEQSVDHFQDGALIGGGKPLAAWGDVLHDGDLAEAILDRLLERGAHFAMRGRSYRTRHLKEEESPARRAKTALPPSVRQSIEKNRDILWRTHSKTPILRFPAPAAGSIACRRGSSRRCGSCCGGGGSCWTIVDATSIHAPSSTKNATKTWDPEMRQTRKGHRWYFGMKPHVGADPRGIVHSVVATDAAAADGPLPSRLRLVPRVHVTPPDQGVGNFG